MVGSVVARVGVFLAVAAACVVLGTILTGLPLAIMMLVGYRPDWLMVLPAYASVTLGVMARVIPFVYRSRPPTRWRPAETGRLGGMWRRG